MAISPILKWAGGKTQLLCELKKAMPTDYNRYIEPFVGGAALLLNLEPGKAIINDLNSELINMYKMIKDFPDELIEQLSEHDQNHSTEYFYRVREWDRVANYEEEYSKVDRAARLIYLNKTCYNGLFRVNQQGYFNCPIGRQKKPNICEKAKIEAISSYLNNNKIHMYSRDYKEILRYARKNDFVYLDPPYYPTQRDSFTGYTVAGFTSDMQNELKKQCDRLNQRGVFFVLSNSEHPVVYEMYSRYKIRKVDVSRNINRQAKSRRSTELIISNI